MTKKEKWVKKMSDSFYEIENLTPKTVGAIQIDNTIAVMEIGSTTNPGIGVAKCSPEDSFDYDTGIAIAYARMRNFAIPEYVLTDKIPLMKVARGQHFIAEGKHYVKVSEMTEGYIRELGGIYPYCEAYCLDTNELVHVAKVTKEGLVEPYYPKKSRRGGGA